MLQNWELRKTEHIARAERCSDIVVKVVGNVGVGVKEDSEGPEGSQLSEYR